MGSIYLSHYLSSFRLFLIRMNQHIAVEPGCFSSYKALSDTEQLQGGICHIVAEFGRVSVQ